MAGTVTVACKWPSGLVLDLRGEITVQDNGAGVKQASAPILKKVELRGSAEQRRLESDGNVTGEVGHVVGGFGLTEVDADFWAAWLKQNEGNQLLENHVIFAMPKLEDARKEARTISKDVVTGVEPIDPSGDKRMGKGVTKAVETAGA